MNYGFDVKIIYTEKSAYYRSGCKTDVLHNITEIHYNFPSPFGVQVAFESDIHGTGNTRFIDEVKEFEAKVSKKKAKSY